MRKSKKIIALLFTLIFAFSLTGCAAVQNTISEIKGDLVGNSYTITFYDNFGEKNLTVEGEKVNVTGNKIREVGFDTVGNINYNYTLSSMITIDIDGHRIGSCGDTVIFAGEGLTPILNFSIEDIKSESDIEGITSLNRVLNDYKNLFGKPRIVVVKSQLGAPICVFEGEKVFIDVPDDLPKMTKLIIDGKPLYIHRANYQIIDTELFK